MTRLQELTHMFNQVQKNLADLKEHYQNKRKGNAFYKAYSQHVSKLDGIKRKVLLYGTQGSIIEIKGVRNRIGKRNKNLRVTEKFTMYLVNIDPKDVPDIMKIRFKNIVEYTTRVIEPGKIITK